MNSILCFVKKILIPASGIITDIKISPQEHLTNGRELFTLVNISQIQVHTKVLEGVKEGEPVIIEGHFTLVHDARVRIVK